MPNVYHKPPKESKSMCNFPICKLLTLQQKPFFQKFKKMKKPTDASDTRI